MPSRLSKALAVGILFYGMVIDSDISRAKTVAVTCNDDFAGGGAKMRIVYEGSDEKGTMNVSASFGDLTLPAIVSSGADDPEGHEGFGVLGSGTVQAKVPTLASLGACEAQHGAKAPTEGFVSVVRGDPCFAALPSSSSPVPVSARFSIVLLPGDTPGSALEAYSDVVTLRYPDKSEILNGFLELEMLPPPDCKLDHQ